MIESARNLSRFAYDLLSNPPTWVNDFMDGWVLLCVVGFVGFVAVTEIHYRSRRKLVTIDEEELFLAKQSCIVPSKDAMEEAVECKIDKHRSIIEAMGNATSSRSLLPSPSSSGTSLNSLDGVGALDRNNSALNSLRVINSVSELDFTLQSGAIRVESAELTRSSSIQEFQSSSFSRRAPKVYFRPVGESDVYDGRAEMDPSPQPSSPPEDSNRGSRKGFLPFVGKRVSREPSNLSAGSGGSGILGGSGRFLTAFLNPRPSVLSVDDTQDQSHDRIQTKSRSVPDLMSSSPGNSPKRLTASLGSFTKPRRSTALGPDLHPRECALADEATHVALEKDECGICFSLLHKEPVAVCTNEEGRPTCLHIYHDRCLKTLRCRRCLFCQAKFRFRRRIPDVDIDPKGWFETVDIDQSGGLTPREIARVLAAQLPIDRKALEALLFKHWSKWDHDMSGEVDPAEFFAEKRGLLTFLKKKRTLFKLVEPEIAPPDIRYDARSWFEYFDRDRSNTLSKPEVLRGLILSFALSNEPLICLNLRRVLDSVWFIFDTDDSGTITKQEFLEPKTGLAASLNLSLTLTEQRKLEVARSVLRKTPLPLGT